MSDERYMALQNALAARPDLGALIQGSRGLRKVRWAAGGRGKRGGARIIYYWAVEQETIVLLFIYPKNTRADLTQRQVRELRRIIDEEYP